MLRASAVDQRVAAIIPQIEAIKHLASRFGLNTSSPKAKEELIVVVACHERTRTQGITLKANETKTESAHCRSVLTRAWSSVSRAFVAIRRVEMKKGGACYKSPLSRKTQEAFHR